jgi:uncharacterized membrane protein
MGELRFRKFVRFACVSSHVYRSVTTKLLEDVEFPIEIIFAEFLEKFVVAEHKVFVSKLAVSNSIYVLGMLCFQLAFITILLYNLYMF